MAGAITSLREDPSTASAGFAGGSILSAFVFGTLGIAFRRVGLFSIPVDIVLAYRECHS